MSCDWTNLTLMSPLAALLIQTRSPELSRSHGCGCPRVAAVSWTRVYISTFRLRGSPIRVGTRQTDWQTRQQTGRQAGRGSERKARSHTHTRTRIFPWVQVLWHHKQNDWFRCYLVRKTGWVHQVGSAGCLSNCKRSFQNEHQHHHHHKN